ncbi:CHAT domain-containing protein [Winogradskyella wichelsiae]|uniref:CHAT domain-containing protein n=1 Tax=Winogradskyella wichelsiae TaxID=2697007 RepID=UPI0015CA4BAF|nr:CHAT domain-containing protein [Winogradskyella wichelsiae]
MLFGNSNMIKKGVVIFLILLSAICYAQDLEESIYVATETFHQNQTNEGLEQLNIKSLQFEKQLNKEDDYYAFINLLVNKAYFLNKINRSKEAISAYEKAHEIYIHQHINSYDIVEYCLIPLGILYHKTNAYLKAEQIITLYINLAQKQNNNQQQITGFINLAKLYQSLSKHQQVMAIVAKGLKIEGIKNRQKRNLNYIKRKSELLIESNQKRLSLDNDVIGPRFNPKNAETYQLNYETALENEDYETAYTNLNLLKNLKINKLTSARSRAKFNFQEAQLHYLRDENDKALAKLRTCLAILLPNFDKTQRPKPKDLYPENTFMDIFDLWAALETDPEKKLQYYDLSFYISESLTQENTNQESYILSANTNKDRSEKCIRILYDLFQIKGESSYIKRAFQYAERNKALGLKWYTNKRTFLKQHPKDSLLLAEQQLLKQQQHFSNKLLNRPINKTQLLERDTLQLQLITTSTQLKKLQDSITKTYNKSSLYNLNIEVLKSKLKTDEACLVEYFSGNNDIYQFIFSPNHIAFNRIENTVSNRNSISKFISYFENASVINNDVLQFTEDAFQLYTVLNLKDIATYQNVVIIADGLLNFIPFESLLTNATTTSNYSDMPFMVKKHRIAYQTSASFYNDTKPYAFKNSALGVFPVFDNSNIKLTYSIDEAERLDDAIKTEFLMYNAATKKDVLKQINDYSILHLSTHANSGDFTTAANIDFIDSKLSLQELYNLDLKSDLVVLSACETGVGMLQKGEGSMNLARGFKYAGISNMVVSLWKINDLSTSKIMSHFYNDLRQTESAFSANQSSKLAYLNSDTISNAKKSPYYWSAFIYSGDVTPAKSFNYINMIIYSIIGLIIASLILLLIYKRQLWKR